MEAKSSSQMGHIRRSFYPMFANCVHTKTMFVDVSDHEKLFHQFVANATGILRIAKTFEILFLFWKNERFASKKNFEIF